MFLTIDSITYCFKLQQDLDALALRCSQNQLDLNVNKCKIMSFYRISNKVNYYSINNITLPSISSEFFLQCKKKFKDPPKKRSFSIVTIQVFLKFSSIKSCLVSTIFVLALFFDTLYMCPLGHIICLNLHIFINSSTESPLMSSFHILADLFVKLKLILLFWKHLFLISSNVEILNLNNTLKVAFICLKYFFH